VKRTTWVLAGAAVLAAVVAAGGVAVTSGAKQASAAAQPAAANTAQVEKRTLSAMVSQPGTLTYRARSDGSPYSVTNRARGTYTQLPAVGQVVHQGQVLYQVTGSPVVLLYGQVPAYRDLSDGMTGTDVTELNAGLVKLGYATSAQLDPHSDYFSLETAYALEKLQAKLGVTQTGTLTLGQAVFLPAAIQVTGLGATTVLGGPATPGSALLTASSTTPVVTVDLDAAQQTEVKAGEHVSITLPSNQVTPGVVSSVGTVATAPSSDSSSAPGSSSGSGTTHCGRPGTGPTRAPSTAGVRPRRRRSSIPRTSPT